MAMLFGRCDDAHACLESKARPSWEESLSQLLAQSACRDPNIYLHFLRGFFSAGITLALSPGAFPRLRDELRVRSLPVACCIIIREFTDVLRRLARFFCDFAAWSGQHAGTCWRGGPVSGIQETTFWRRTYTGRTVIAGALIILPITAGICYIPVLSHGGVVAGNGAS